MRVSIDSDLGPGRRAEQEIFLGRAHALTSLVYTPMTQSPKSSRNAITVGPVTKQAQIKLVEQKSLAAADVPALTRQCGKLIIELTRVYAIEVAAREFGVGG